MAQTLLANMVAYCLPDTNETTRQGLQTSIRQWRENIAWPVVCIDFFANMNVYDPNQVVRFGSILSIANIRALFENGKALPALLVQNNNHVTRAVGWAAALLTSKTDPVEDGMLPHDFFFDGVLCPSKVVEVEKFLVEMVQNGFIFSKFERLIPGKSIVRNLLLMEFFLKAKLSSREIIANSVERVIWPEETFIGVVLRKAGIVRKRDEDEGWEDKVAAGDVHLATTNAQGILAAPVSELQSLQQAVQTLTGANTRLQQEARELQAALVSTKPKSTRSESGSPASLKQLQAEVEKWMEECEKKQREIDRLQSNATTFTVAEKGTIPAAGVVELFSKHACAPPWLQYVDVRRAEVICESLKQLTLKIDDPQNARLFELYQSAINIGSNVTGTVTRKNTADSKKTALTFLFMLAECGPVNVQKFVEFCPDSEIVLVISSLWRIGSQPSGKSAKRGFSAGGLDLSELWLIRAEGHEDQLSKVYSAAFDAQKS